MMRLEDETPVGWPSAAKCQCMRLEFGAQAERLLVDSS